MGHACQPSLERFAKHSCSVQYIYALADLSVYQEIDLSLFWECPFFLLQALPFAFTTEGNHVIGHNDLQNNAPSSVQLSKRYYETHLADIKKRFEHAQELGTGSAEEWTKGLAQEGQQRIDDMIRWEQWEAKGGLRRVNAPPPLKTNTQGNISMKSKLPHTLFQDERPSNVAESHSSEHFSSSSISQQATGKRTFALSEHIDTIHV